VAAGARRPVAHGRATRLSIPALLAALLAVASAAAADDPAPLGACGPIARRYDVVEVAGAHFRGLGGTPLGRLGLLAFRGGRAAPIPFQIDEKRGRKIALDQGKEPTQDDKPGVLDAEDLLVFLPCDAGERAPAGASPDGAREIRLEDPLTHAVGFVYLLADEHPVASDRRYVRYDAGNDFVGTARYRIGMVSALPNYFALVAPDGTVGPDLIDGLRLRAEARLKADLAHWTLNEGQGEHELIAWKAGPVRVIRRSRHQVVVGLGIHLTAGLANTFFYPHHVYGPGSLKLPFSPGILFREITAYGAIDGRDLRGWRYIAQGTPAGGFAIDGHMDDAEHAFDSSGDWFVLTHGEDAILFVTRMSENLRHGITLKLLYRDDATRPNPPERVPGTVPLAGYEGSGVEKLPGGRYTFALHIFTLEHYHGGDERPVLAQLDAPLAVSVDGDRGVNARAVPGADPAAAP